MHTSSHLFLSLTFSALNIQRRDEGVAECALRAATSGLCLIDWHSLIEMGNPAMTLESCIEQPDTLPQGDLIMTS